MSNKMNFNKFTPYLSILGIILSFLSLMRAYFNITFEDEVSKYVILFVIIGFISSFLLGKYLTILNGDNLWKPFPLQKDLNGLKREMEITLKNLEGTTRSIFIGIYKGWLKQVKEEIQTGGDSIIEIDGDYYERCLAEIKSSNHIIAIADLTNDLEKNAWLKTISPSQAIVKERVFLINWIDFFDEALLFKLNQAFKNHSEIYQISINHVPLDQSRKITHLGNRVGNHFFFAEPDFVGGYIEVNERILLRAINDSQSFEEARSLFNDLKKQAVKFEPHFSSENLRKQWISQNGIGFWNPKWGDKVAMRDASYFTNYDMHIRCWIPDYDHYVLEAFNLIKSNMLNLFRVSNQEMKILEIGYGTGALTRHILLWIDMFEKPLKGNGTNNSVKYYGIDSAKEQMFKHTHYDLHEDKPYAQFYQGTAFDSMPPEIRKIAKKTKYDLVCSSLVLHDINTEDPNPNFEKMLVHLSDLVGLNGIVIFADLFWTYSDKINAKRLNVWKEFMSKNLSENDVLGFINANQDMVKSLKEEDAIEISFKHGYETKFVNSTYSENSPFKFMIMKRLK